MTNFLIENYFSNSVEPERTRVDIDEDKVMNILERAVDELVRLSKGKEPFAVVIRQEDEELPVARYLSPDAREFELAASAGNPVKQSGRWYADGIAIAKRDSGVYQDRTAIQGLDKIVIGREVYSDNFFHRLGRAFAEEDWVTTPEEIEFYESRNGEGIRDDHIEYNTQEISSDLRKLDPTNNHNGKSVPKAHGFWIRA